MSGVVEDQSAVVALLESPATHGGAPVERIDTHAAVIFLAGDHAYKLKRAVRFDYLDFSTAPLRRAACEAERRLNRRTAPTLYRDVLPIARAADGTLTLAGEGTPVDWVLSMTRFPQEALLDRLASRGALDAALMRPLAEAIADFHRDADPRTDHGGRAGMAWVVEGNAAGFEEFGAGVFDEARVAAVNAAARAALARHAGLLDARRDAGNVRHCHGDLHLGNLVLLDGRPTLFDGVEFNDAIACIDVLYDLAFLLMDLWRRGLAQHANLVLNGYRDRTGALDGLSVLPLFLACRAAVRAKTTATAAALHENAEARQAQQAIAREYLALAADLLQPQPPCLVALGGFSGTGKSTIARRLAPALGPVPGAVVLRSDRIRKQMLGVDEHEALPADGYAPGVSQRVYAALAQEAAGLLGEGHSVIVDAVHQRVADRERLARVAVDAQVPFVGVWLDAPEAVLVARVSAREADASDADAAVVRAQASGDAGPLTWTRVQADETPEVVVRRVRAVLEAAGLDVR